MSTLCWKGLLYLIQMNKGPVKGNHSSPHTKVHDLQKGPDDLKVPLMLSCVFQICTCITRFRFTDYSAKEGFMEGLQAKDKSPAWNCQSTTWKPVPNLSSRSRSSNPRFGDQAQQIRLDQQRKVLIKKSSYFLSKEDETREKVVAHKVGRVGGNVWSLENVTHDMSEVKMILFLSREKENDKLEKV